MSPAPPVEVRNRPSLAEGVRRALPERPAPIAFAGGAFGSYLEFFPRVRFARVRGFVVARERAPWTLDRACLGEVTLERGSDGAPFVSFGSIPAGRAVLYGSTSTDGARYANGAAVAGESLFFWEGGERVRLSAPRSGAWFAVSVPAEVLGGEARSGPVRASAARVSRIRGLVAELLDESAALRDARGDRAGSPVRELVEEVRLVVGDASRRRPARDGVDRGRTLAILEEILANRIGEPLYIGDLCAATGLPERTLRHVVVEQFGVSPVRLLRRRRLCALREALRTPTGRPGAISAAAADLGVVHRGELSAAYSELFGELPSETLRGCSA